ncbi:zinc ribbon domain-containing protein [Streptococcus halichoeri]|uniref:zinc ribbon domain-containing protein n=1 Tax=Streptococcus halichoeri TaxID=254785 RepID=UPI001358D04D|nr:hypothetical protein [Streptococcus halichoeri]
MMKPRHKGKLALMVLVGLVLLGLAGGAFYFSKGATATRYVKARQKPGNTFENIKAFLIWQDNNQQLTSDEARFATFNKLTTTEAKQMKAVLKSASSGDATYMKVVGRRFGIFPDYRVAVKPLTLTIKTNVAKSDILLNQKLVATTQTDHDTLVVKRLPEASYHITLNGNYKGKPVHVTKDYDGQETTIDLSVAIKQFKVVSDLKDGEVYADGIRIGTLKDGSFAVTDFPVTPTSKLFVKKNFPDGQLKSKKVPLAPISDGETVDVSIGNLLDDNMATKVLLSAFNHLMAYTVSQQDPPDLAAVFEQGASNAFYKGLKESVKSKLMTDRRKASHFAIPNISLRNLQQVGKTSYVLDFAALYDYTYDKDTDPAKQTSGHVTQDISGQMTVKKRDGHYLVSHSGTNSITATGEKSDLKAPAIFPEDLIGTWSMDKDGVHYRLAFAKDGKVSLSQIFKDKKKAPITKSLKVLKAEEKGDKRYVFTCEPGADTTVFTIGGGLGGQNVAYAHGALVDGNKLTLLLWQTQQGHAFDYSKPLPGPRLTKE